MKPLVTVITITYNLVNANRLAKFYQSLESIHNQTYSNIEHIIIDGASTDGTLDIIQQYVDKGWVKCFSEPDTGIYNAFNNGIKRANGDFIVFVNSDDFYHSPLGIEKSVDALLKSGADFSYADDMVLDEKKNKSRIRKANIYSIFQGMPFCHQTMFVKKEVFERFGNFNESYKSAGDYEFVIRIFMAGCKGIKTKHNFCTFRLGGESTTNERKSQKECIRLFQELYKPLYELSYKQAWFMLHIVITPPKLIVRLIKYFTGFDKILFLNYYLKRVLKTYRRWIIQYRNSSDERKFRLWGKHVIKHINYEHEEHIKEIRENLAKQAEINSETHK